MSALTTGTDLRCDHAGCTAAGTVARDAWSFCAGHAGQHEDEKATAPRPVRVAAPAEIHELPVRVLAAHPDNIRTDLGDLTDMTASVRAQGILQPLLVTRGEQGQYVVLAGHRRLAAAITVGLPRVPVTVRRHTSGTAAVEAMLVENLQRENLNPLDEADGYRRLVDAGRTWSQISTAVGKNVGHISMRLALLNLTPAEQRALRAGEITLTAGYQAGRARSPNKLPAGQRRGKPRKVPHFTIAHPQAEAAAGNCEHETTLKLGVACGPCWEQAIRDDERARLRRTAP